LLLASACSIGHTSLTAGTAVPVATRVPPPARSGIDDTITVTYALADSFDVLPDGTCAGRSSNSGIRDGARVQLRGDTVGGSVWATATARFVHQPPRMYSGVNGPWLVDDGLYCVAKAVFPATRPDPGTRYSIKFVGGDWRGGVNVRSRFWMYDFIEQTGYGSTYTGSQLCPNLADPPDKDCE
jgi:hypothetical protein